MDTEKTKAAHEALLLMLNDKKSTYVETVVPNGSSYIHRSGDTWEELGCRITVDDAGKFTVWVCGKASLNARPRRYDDRDVECDTFAEALKWAKRRLTLLGKRVSEAKAAQEVAKVEEEKRKAARAEHIKAWKAIVAEHLPGAFVRKGTDYDQGKAVLAGSVNGYNDRISVDVDLPYNPGEAKIGKATVDVEWTGDPEVACKFATRVKALADELGMTFTPTTHETKAYRFAFNSKQEG